MIDNATVDMSPMFAKVMDWYVINDKYYPKYRDWLISNIGPQRHGWINGGPQVRVGAGFVNSWMMFDKGEDALAFKMAFYDDFI